jgi:CRISPR-associated protein Csb2
MPHSLVLSVRFHDGRYHGLDTSGRQEWPPSPARLFQALVAGSARAAAIQPEDIAALTWLERLEPPIIAAPAACKGQRFKHFMPNNDLDSVGGDPSRLGEIRTATKIFHPRVFDPAIAFLYIWQFDHGTEHGERIRDIADQIYQLGRGIDMAWAWGEILDAAETETRLVARRGVLHRPSRSGTGTVLACPKLGSLASLTARFNANRIRFTHGTGKQQLFTQAPKASFASIAYDSPSKRLLFDLRGTAPQAPFAPWPFTKAIALVERLRDGAAERLRQALPERAGEVERIFIGRDAREADKAARIRIMPLPSIGHAHVDHAIRRVLIEIPPNCPMAAEDIAWGFSGLDVTSDRETGEIWSLLVPADDEALLKHFGFDGAFRIWRTVTPAALPEKAARRRIEPSRIRDRAEQKGATERIAEEVRAASAVRQALRHAQIDAPIEMIRVQREPFEAKGERAEAFAPGARFAKERLWHVEVAFTKAVRGPLVLGDGRYLGLGLFTPLRETRSIFAFALTPLASGVDSRRGPSLRPPTASEAKREAGSNPEANRHTWIASSPAASRNNAAAHEEIRSCDQSLIAAAARRAVMARVQDTLRGKPLPAFFTGHEPNGAPHRPGHHAHLFYAVDVASEPARLLIIAPHRVEHRNAGKWEPERLHELEEALTDFTILRAGKAGLFKLSPLGEQGADDSLCGPARTWVSATPYRPTRHPKSKTGIEDALIGDVLSECARRNLPRPDVEVLTLTAGPRGGICARLRLGFAVAVEGPILLGRDSHESGGVFCAESLGSRYPPRQ